MALPVPITEVNSCSVIETCCVCCLPNEHDGEHLCVCGGSWTYDEENKMVPHMFPGGLTAEDAKKSFNNFFGLYSDWGLFADDDDYGDYGDDVTEI